MTATAETGTGAAGILTGNFFSSGLRQAVDRLMDVLWAGGVNNPMDSIEQISYLVFLRLLSEKDTLLGALDPRYEPVFAGEWAKFAWGNFVTLSGDELFDAAREAIERFDRLPGLSTTGRSLFRQATLKIYDRPTLRAVVQAIDRLELEGEAGQDLKGDMYEYLLSRLSVAGTNGQFRTPRHIIALIVALVEPQPGERICDPACGTGGFLVAAFTQMLRRHTSKESAAQGSLTGDLLSPAQWQFIEEAAFTGYDNDANMVKLAILNLYLHRLEQAAIEFHNPLTTRKGGSYPGEVYEVILANPPFAGAIQRESVLEDLNLETRDTELLFLKWFIDHLAPAGRAGVIVPNGVLFGGNKATKRVREILLTECALEAVVSLPSGVFKPYSGVGTAALVFRKGGPTQSVWFYELSADGFSLDDKRTPVAHNDIPDVLAAWPNRGEGTRSFVVPVERIRENDLSLAAGRYRPVTQEAIEHEDPRAILADVLSMEEEIAQRVRGLMGVLGA
ncbi:MAG: class I SAM-dependent DNA methyltransferase [Dehalococcoidia bacterium]